MSTITVTVTKTIQEQQYEPYLVSVTATKEVGDNVSITSEVDDLYMELDLRVDEYISVHREKSQVHSPYTC